ncbi:MAG: adenylate kinase [Kiritimatiellaceae bacterium]|nr:adenylate kinase [Kiritimatiellaceae bacterium]
MEAIILLGGPGAGKGTLADFLKKQTSYLHVSTGDMLRAAIQAGSSVGLEAKAFMEAGQLVPDSVILRIIEERISQEPAGTRFMFDGFPRTIEQAKGLDLLFKKRGGAINHVFNLAVPNEIILQRLTGRRICKTCGAVYHMTRRPSAKEGVCDMDAGELYQRADDSEATIRNRLDVYEKQTAPLIHYYQQQSLIRDIAAGGSAAETDALVLKVLTA